MKFHEFTEDEFKLIKQKAMLNKEMSEIFELKILGYTEYQIAMKVHLGERTVSRRVKELKKKIKRVL